MSETLNGQSVAREAFRDELDWLAFCYVTRDIAFDNDQFTGHAPVAGNDSHGRVVPEGKSAGTVAPLSLHKSASLEEPASFEEFVSLEASLGPEALAAFEERLATDLEACEAVARMAELVAGIADSASLSRLASLHCAVLQPCNESDRLSGISSTAHCEPILPTIAGCRAESVSGRGASRLPRFPAWTAALLIGGLLAGLWIAQPTFRPVSQDGDHGAAGRTQASRHPKESTIPELALLFELWRESAQLELSLLVLPVAGDSHELASENDLLSQGELSHSEIDYDVPANPEHSPRETAELDGSRSDSQEPGTSTAVPSVRRNAPASERKVAGSRAISEARSPYSVPAWMLAAVKNEQRANEEPEPEREEF